MTTSHWGGVVVVSVLVASFVFKFVLGRKPSTTFLGKGTVSDRIKEAESEAHNQQ
jgi:hypothetical protein